DRPYPFGKRAPELLQRGARLRRRLRINEVTHGFGLNQIHLAVRHGAKSEFPRSSQARAGISDGLDNAGQDERIAVSTDFQHILARVGVRTLKEGCYDIIDRCAVFIKPTADK